MSARPLMIFDGDCGFCRRWIARWQHATGDRVEYEPFQSAAARFPHIPREDFAGAVHLIDPEGTHSRGAEAVFRALHHGGRRWPLALYQRVPGFARASESLYRLVAGHRNAAGRVTDLLWGAHVVPPGEARTVALFVRAIGVVFAIAFVSLWVQVIGLVGESGILPAGEYLDAVRSKVGPVRYWFVPTVFWLGAGDAALHAVCAGGLACSLAVVAGFIPGAGLFLSWAAYLSLLGVGQNFLRFQWDTLLLEAGVVAMLLAPWRWRLRGNASPPRATLWLARWLLVRLMITSAVVKLTSGDPTWRNLTALDYHYFTQPLPPWLAWYAQQWPAWFQKLSVLVMFAVEGLAPLLVFGPRRVRLLGAAAIAGLQLLIMATGNYGFFNLLALALCIPLLDDGLWVTAANAAVVAPRARNNPVTRMIIVLIFTLTLVPFAGAFGFDTTRIGPLDVVSGTLEPLRLANRYGLFAVMTTERPEIIIEGSRDAVEWKAYELRYKPGDVAERPRFTTPHMPRLDWQMWFAALGRVQENRWFLVLCWRLLQGSEDARAFFAVDPFGDEPPRYIRATVYTYRFTTSEERRASGGWWKRTERGQYVRTLMLQNGVLTTAPETLPE